MSQTSYSLNIPAYAQEGALADAAENDVRTGLAEIAIPFGKFCIRGTDKDNQVLLPGLATDITALTSVAGFALHDQAREQVSSGTPGYPLKAAVSILLKGKMVALAEQTCVAGDPVFVRYAAGGSGVGSVGNTAGTSERALLAGARWAKGAAAGQLGVIEVNMPQ